MDHYISTSFLIPQLIKPFINCYPPGAFHFSNGQYILLSPQTESIPSLVHGTDILLNLLPPTVKEFIVLCIDALVIKDLGQLWQYLKQQHHESSRVPTIADDFQSNVLLIKHHDNIDSSDTRATNIMQDVIVPCGTEDDVWCQHHVISQQMQVEDSIAYHETHSSLKYDGHVRENVYLNCDHFSDRHKYY